MVHFHQPKNFAYVVEEQFIRMNVKMCCQGFTA